jgi:hypothetical protein
MKLLIATLLLSLLVIAFAFPYDDEAETLEDLEATTLLLFRSRTKKFRDCLLECERIAGERAREGCKESCRVRFGRKK